MSNLNILGLCGSLRKGSLNRMAMNLASHCMPEGMTLEMADWRDVPMFDGDVMATGMPPAVTALVDRIRRADGVLIATPEYNYSVPGPLKNAIDWVSRVDNQPFAGKPVAILSASMGPLGGARVQYDLRKIFLFLNGAVLVKPEVFIGAAHTKFDAATGQCTDDTTRKFVGDQMLAFQKWIAGVQRMAG